MLKSEKDELKILMQEMKIKEHRNGLGSTNASKTNEHKAPAVTALEETASVQRGSIESAAETRTKDVS